MEAAATGSPNSEKSVVTGWPSSSSTVATAITVGKGGSLSCRTRSWLARSTPTTSGRVDRTWPNLM